MSDDDDGMIFGHSDIHGIYCSTGEKLPPVIRDTNTVLEYSTRELATE